ncbi:MAG: REDY-like protein HapK [Ponticaulis sp.]|nr:REDY-like protein HapK [Ponticaulis sp.]
MAHLILTYTLKKDVTNDQFENWVRTTDYPKMRSLSRVSSFRTFRTEGLLLGEGSPAHQYVEVFDIPDLDGFTSEDMPGGVVQSVMGEFMMFVDNPQFMIASEVI